MTMKRDDIRDAVYEAQEHIGEAIRLLEIYVRETNDAAAEAYIVDQLKIIAGNGHGFLADDMNLDDLLEALDEREPGDEEENSSAPALVKVSPYGYKLYWCASAGRYVSVPED